MSIRQHYKAYVATNAAKSQKQGGNTDRANSVPHQDMTEREKVIERLKRKGNS